MTPTITEAEIIPRKGSWFIYAQFSDGHGKPIFAFSPHELKELCIADLLELTEQAAVKYLKHLILAQELRHNKLVRD